MPSSGVFRPCGRGMVMLPGGPRGLAASFSGGPRGLLPSLLRGLRGAGGSCAGASQERSEGPGEHLEGMAMSSWPRPHGCLWGGFVPGAARLRSERPGSLRCRKGDGGQVGSPGGCLHFPLPSRHATPQGRGCSWAWMQLDSGGGTAEGGAPPPRPLPQQGDRQRGCPASVPWEHSSLTDPLAGPTQPAIGACRNGAGGGAPAWSSPHFRGPASSLEPTQSVSQSPAGLPPQTAVREWPRGGGGGCCAH